MGSSWNRAYGKFALLLSLSLICDEKLVYQSFCQLEFSDFKFSGIRPFYRRIGDAEEDCHPPVASEEYIDKISLSGLTLYPRHINRAGGPRSARHAARSNVSESIVSLALQTASTMPWTSLMVPNSLSSPMLSRMRRTVCS